MGKVGEVLVDDCDNIIGSNRLSGSEHSGVGRPASQVTGHQKDSTGRGHARFRVAVVGALSERHDGAVTALREVLMHAATRAADYRNEVAERSVFPSSVDIDAVRAALGVLRDEPAPARDAVDEFANAVEPALVACTGPRYFGFVIGGALDAATAADMLTTGWDQNAFNAYSSPAAAVVEEIAGSWLKELLGLPPSLRSGS